MKEYNKELLQRESHMEAPFSYTNSENLLRVGK